MRNHRPPDEPTPFGGNLRHYHRAGAPPQRSWDEWVDGAPAGPPRTKKWWKIIAVSLAVLVLCGIVAGLIIELS